MSFEEGKFSHEILNDYHSFAGLNEDEIREIENEFEKNFYHGYLREIFGNTDNIPKDTIEMDINEITKSMLEGVDTDINDKEIFNFIMRESKEMIKNGLGLKDSDKSSLLFGKKQGWIRKAIKITCENNVELKNNTKIYNKSMEVMEEEVSRVLCSKIKYKIGIILGVSPEKIIKIIRDCNGEERLKKMLKKNSKKRFVKLLKKDN